MGIDCLKLVFAVAVVFQHMTSTSNYSIQTNALIAEVQHRVDGAVAGFFLLSGTFFRPEVSVNLQSFLQLLRRTAARLLLPFFFFSIVYSVMLAAFGKLPFPAGLSQTLTLEGVGPQLYFLPLLFGMRVIFGAALSFRHSGVLALALLILAGSVAFSMQTVLATGPDPRLIPFYLTAFLLGYVITPLDRTLLGVGTGKLMTSVIVLSVLAFSDHKAAALLIVVLLFAVAIHASHFMTIPHQRIAGSGGIYLLHTPILSFGIERALLAINVTEIPNLILSWMLTVILSLIITKIALSLTPALKPLLLE